MRKLLIASLAFLLLQQQAFCRQSSGDKQDAPPSQEQLMDEVKKLGPWEDYAPLESEAIGAMFDRYGWKSEADTFALGIVQSVNKVPPWNHRERQDVFLNALQERYDLSGDQRRQVNRLFNQEMLRLTLNHFSKLAPLAMEVIKTRTSNEPFTPEQVARWTQAIRPIAEEGREAIDRVARELAKGMNDKQKALLKTDLKAFNRRHRTITDQMLKWEQGEWKPEDWGMANDPIQTGQRKAGGPKTLEAADAQSKAAAPQAAPQTQPAAEAAFLAEGEWERYVREFAEKHGFSDAQRKSASGILHDMRTRAEQYRKSKVRDFDEIKKRQAATADAKQLEILRKQQEQLESPVREMFNELKRRLDGLLTAEQRARAGQNAKR